MQEQEIKEFGTDKSFKVLFEHATIGIVVGGKRSVIKLANPYSEKIFGYKKGELKGLSLNSLFADGLKNIYEEHYSTYFKSPKERSMGSGIELTGKRKDGTLFPIEISLGHYDLEEGIFVVNYIKDISIRKKSENELSKLNKELELRIEQRTKALAKAINELAASKDELEKALAKEKELNELKSRFVTTASHEFRTPLATILSSASIIKQYNEKEEEGKRKKHIERIESSVINLIDILGDFLSLDKLEEGVVKIKTEPLHLEEFIRSILKENKFIMKKDQKVNYRHIGGETEIEVDSHVFKNVILNLFSNAVKYSPEKTPIDITTWVENGMVELKIKDHGMGIPEKDQKYLFTRFFRAKNAMHIEGTGLGLNIIKKYIELMKGGISFSSTLGEGTIFTIKIPVKV